MTMRAFLQRSVLTLCVFVSASAFAETSFRGVLRSPTYHALTKICFADATTMYAIGDGATFVRTTDAGATFAVVNVSGAGEFLHGCDFTSAQVGAVFGDNGLVAATLNGGLTWTVHYVPGGGTLLDGRFNPTTGAGFALSDSGKIFYTPDAGANWQVVLNPDSGSATPNKMLHAARLTSTTFLALADKPSVLYSSTNGGQSWTRLTNPAMTDSRDMFFRDDKNGWIVTKGYAAFTTDGGATWQAGTQPTSQNYSCVFALDDNRVWELYAGGSLGGIAAPLCYRNPLWTYGGAQPIFSDGKSIGDTATPLYAFRFDATGAIGWAVGNAGDIRMSVDSGKTWKSKSTGPSGDIRAMSFFDDKHGFVTASIRGSGGIFGTSDGGVSWTRQATGENPMACGRMTDVTHGVALFKEGTGYVTVDSLRWTADTMPPPGGSGIQLQFARIYQVTTNVLWTCGGQGLIEASTDEGHHWISRKTSSSDPEFGDYDGLAFTDPTHGFVCGGNGLLIKTGDGGTSWSTVDAGVSTEVGLTDMAFASSTSGWITTDIGNVLHSTDGGATWQAVDIGARDTLTRVVFANSYVGWVGGTSGQLYQTHDGGATWQTLATGTLNPIKEISFYPRSAPNALWLSGGYGMLLNGPVNANGVSERTPAARPGSCSLGATYPNPFVCDGSPMSVAMSFAMPAEAQLDVVNVRGERVRTISRGQYDAGSYTAVWDGRDAAGAAVPPGVYFFALSAGAAHDSRSIVVTH